MAEIGFIPLPSAGHLFPTFKLAKSLQARGHSVTYYVGASNGKPVIAQGLQCLTVLEDLMQRACSLTSADASEYFVEANKFLLRNRREVLKLFKSCRPNVLLVDRFLPAIALIASSAAIPSLLLQSTPDLQMSNYVLSGILTDREIDGSGATVSSRFLRLALFPKEFDFPRNITLREGWYYVECMDLTRVEPRFSWERVAPEKPLIFCALGSMANYLYKESKTFFETVIQAMSLRPDWQMVLATGPGLNAAEFTSVPSNVILVDWAPQLTVLGRASLMITHGGTGTVKECIISGVPMIVFPLAADHPAMAARVVYHGLGVRADIRRVAAADIVSLIQQLEGDPSFKRRVESMGERFLKFEHSQQGVKVIEKILALQGQSSEKHSSNGKRIDGIPPARNRRPPYSSGKSRSGAIEDAETELFPEERRG